MRARTGILLLLTLPFLAGAALAAPKQKQQKYVLKYQPAVGQRVSYAQSVDLSLSYTAAGTNNNRSIEQSVAAHSQVVVDSEETLELGGDGTPVAKRVVFGPNCWSSEQRNTEPAEKRRLVYAGKTVNFRVAADGSIEQDFGVKPGRQEMKFLREVMRGRAPALPDHPVSVGERWQNDDAMRTLMDLAPADTVSTVFTLKSIREQDGRRVAEIGLSAAVIKANARGFNEEISIEGAALVDVQTGLSLRSDLVGQETVSARVGGGVHFTGSGSLEMHYAAKILPNADPNANANANAKPAATR
jgi:hypothetical protein